MSYLMTLSNQQICLYTHPKVSRENIVGGDHHILRGQKPLAPVALWAVIQIHPELHISAHMLLKLVLHMRKNKNCQKEIKRNFEYFPLIQAWKFSVRLYGTIFSLAFLGFFLVFLQCVNDAVTSCNFLCLLLCTTLLTIQLLSTESGVTMRVDLGKSSAGSTPADSKRHINILFLVMRKINKSGCDRDKHTARCLLSRFLLLWHGAPQCCSKVQVLLQHWGFSTKK